VTSTYTTAAVDQEPVYDHKNGGGENFFVRDILSNWINQFRRIKR